MPCAVDGLADCGDVGSDTGGGVVVDHTNGFDGVVLVFHQGQLDLFRFDALLPASGEKLCVQAKLPGQLVPSAGEVPSVIHQHQISG